MSRKVEVVPASPAHVGTIAARIRQIDAMECRAMGRTPKQSLRLGLLGSSIAWTAKVDGRAEAMFGVTPASLIEGEGTPWFLGTDEVYRHGRELLKWAPLFLSAILDSSPRLSNVVMAENARAIRLLRAWGFTVGGDVQMIGGQRFLPFWMVR